MPQMSTNFLGKGSEAGQDRSREARVEQQNKTRSRSKKGSRSRSRSEGAGPEAHRVLWTAPGPSKTGVVWCARGVRCWWKVAR